MSIEEKLQGIKLVGIRDEHGHCERVFAFAVAAVPAIDWVRQVADSA